MKLILAVLMAALSVRAAEVSMIVTASAGSHGDQITVDLMNDGTISSIGGTWSLDSITSVDIITTNKIGPFPIPPWITGTNYFGFDDNALQFGFDGEGQVDFDPTISTNNAEAAGWMQFHINAATSTDNRDLFILVHTFNGTSEGAVMQLDGDLLGNFMLRVHSSSAGAGDDIPAEEDTPYWFELYDFGFQVELWLYDTNFGLVGFSTLATPDNTNGITNVEIGNVNDHGGSDGGYVRFDSLMLRAAGPYTQLKRSIGVPSRRYVSPSGNNSNGGTNSASAWADIDYAWDKATNANNRIIVEPGVYSTAISPSQSGTAGDLVWIYADAPNTVTNESPINFGTVGYVGFRHIDMDGEASDNRGFEFGDTAGIEFWDMTMKGYLQWYVYMPDGDSCTDCLFTGMNFEGDHTNGSGFISLVGTNSIIQYNRMTRANEDYMFFAGLNNIIRNQFGDDPDADSAAHVDFLQTGSGISTTANNFGNLSEANLYHDSTVAGTDHHYLNFSNSDDADAYGDFLSRRNVMYNIGTVVGSIFQTGGGAQWNTNVVFVNETFVLANRAATQTTEGTAISSENGAKIKNVIAWKLWGTSVDDPDVWSASPGSIESNGNLFYDPDATLTLTGAAAAETDSIVNQNPSFTSFASQDFTLNGGPAVGSGIGVATVTSMSGTGTSFTVNDASYFRGPSANGKYNKELTRGDTITVGSDVIEIASISGNTITATASFTWAQSDDVFIGADATPDMGAYPASHVALTAAELDGTGTGTLTVTPNGDARMAVRFVDGIPVQVIYGTGPYTFTELPGRTDEIKVYPLYASETLSVTAGESTPLTYTIGPGAAIGTGVRFQ